VRTAALIQREGIEQRLYFLRGEKVMLSTDLARLYQVASRALVQAVKRNANRFPDDFMFHLTSEEFQSCSEQPNSAEPPTTTRDNARLLLINVSRKFVREYAHALCFEAGVFIDTTSYSPGSRALCHRE
jgi:hypothetical protein